MFTHPVKSWIVTADLDANMRNWTKMSACNHSAVFAKAQYHIVDPTNPGGTLDNGVEDRLHIGGGAADDAEHLGRCGLMFQGFAQFCVALLQFFEQADVLDGDDRLRGKGLEKGNLLICE